MILFFAEKCVLKAKLLKELFYADFLYYKETGFTGLEYAKINYGSVIDEYKDIIYGCVEKGLINYDIEFKNDYECHNIKKISDINLNIFSNEELSIINKVKDYFKGFKSNYIVRFLQENQL